MRGRMMNRLSWCVVLAASLVGTACNKSKSKDAGKEGSAGSGSAASTAGSTDKAAPAGAIDDELIAAAAKAGKGCKLEPAGYFNYDCPENTAFVELVTKKTSGLMMTDPKFAPTYLKLLEDKNVGVQQMAANKMYENTDWYATDKAAQERILTVAGAVPKDAAILANKLGRLIGFFKLDKTGLFDKVKALADNANTPEALRTGIVNWLLAGNPTSEPAYAVVRDAAKSDSKAIKTAALVGLSAAYPTHATDEMCKLWVDAMPTLDEAPASLVAAHLTNGDLQVFNENEAFPYNWAMVHSDTNKCPAEAVTAALDFVDKQVTAGNAKGIATWWLAALKGPIKSKNGSDADKAKAAAIAKKYADTTTYGGYQRGEAIEVLVDADPAAAKEYADKYASDADASLKSAAERVKGKLAKKG